MSAPSEIKSVAVVGGGLMGSGIAEAVAVAGLPVVIRDIDDLSVQRARERIEKWLDRAVAGGKLDAAPAAVARSRVELPAHPEAIAGADLVIEAVPEDERLKVKVMHAIGEIVGDERIVASN